MALAPSGQLGMATPFGELLGMNDAEMNAEFADYVKLGVDWVRTDFWWNQVQSSQGGGYNWTQIDKVVNAAAAHGIKVVGLLNGSPAWGGSDMASTTNQQAFAKFAAAAALRYKDKILDWEIFNEMNMGVMTPANYTATLKAAYTAIKGVNANTTVITGGTAAVPQTGNGLYGAVDFLKQMYANGAKGYFDAVGFHPYTYPLLPNNTASWNGFQMLKDGIRATMVANGDSAKQVWMTELGAPTAGGGNAMSQADQALIIQQATDFAHSTSWTGPIMWYSYKDRGGNTADTENWFGLVGPNGEHKAAYTTYQNIATKDNGTVTTPTVPTTPTTPTVETATFSTANHTGTTADNTIIGNDLNNVIDGGAGNDVIKGGKGADRLIGNTGNDKLYGGDGSDVFEFGPTVAFGNDTIMDFVKGIDKIDLSKIDANSALAGIQNFNFIGGNWLAKAGDLGFYQNSGEGLTHIQGDLNGDGIFDFDIAVQGLVTFAATDFILKAATTTTPTTPTSPTTPTLTAAPVGNWVESGMASATLKGTAAADTVRGTDKNELIDGGSGIDSMIGGKGDDTYVASSKLDKVVELAGEGIDSIRVWDSSYALGAHVENLRGYVATGMTLTGNSADNIIRGHTGNDTIVGMAGIDKLYGDLGRDTFKFNNVTEGKDRIMDFKVAEDFLDIRGIKASLGATSLTITAVQKAESVDIVVGYAGKSYDVAFLEGLKVTDLGNVQNAGWILV